MQYMTKSKLSTFSNRVLNSITNDIGLFESDYFKSIWLSNERRFDEWVNSIPSSYDVYEGYNTLEELVDNFLLPKSRYIIIKFKQQYYAVVYRSGNHQLIIGKEKFIFIENNRRIESDKHPEKYNINYRKRNIGENRIIFHEMKALDPDMKVYIYRKENSERAVEALGEFTYAVGMLGASFKSYDFTLEDLFILNYYYSPTDVVFFKYFLKFYHYISINPFRWTGKKSNGQSVTMPNPYIPFCKPFKDHCNE